MSLVAICPNCGTVFSMVREQLEASNGQVRCGHCMVVFDARVPPIVEPKPTDSQNNQAPVEPAAPIASEQPALAELSFVQLADKQAFWSKKSVLAALFIAALTLLVLLFVQVLRFESERMTQAVPQLQTIVKKVCEVTLCPKRIRLKIDAWRIESSDFQKEGDASFKLTVQLRNTLPTSLLVPQLELSLLDISGALLVRRTMPIAATDESIPNGEDRTYRLLISPEAGLHSKITGYGLVLFYP